MKKAIKWIVLFLFISQFVFAQQNKSILKSNKQDILVKFNTDTIVWRIEPQKNPDIFYIGSTLHKKETWFITDVDSVYFNVEAGKEYNFIIRYNNQDCNTRIVALNNPVLLNRYFGFAVLILVLLIVGIIFYKAFFISSNKLIAFGVVVPVLFWVFTIAAGFIHGNYNHFKNAVSNLGEIGSASEIIMAIFTFVIAICSMVFSIGFYKASKQFKLNILPAILSFTMAISFLWAAIFPAGHQLHGTLGPLPIGIILGALILLFVWKNDKINFKIKWLSGLSVIVMLLFILRFMPTIQQNFEGLVQRTLYLGWSIWCIAISKYFKTRFSNLRIK
jgi:hypothetical membrane protein